MTTTPIRRSGLHTHLDGRTAAEKWRQVAVWMLDLLDAADPERAEFAVGLVRQLGYPEFGPSIVTNDMEDAVTTLRAAQLVQVGPATIRRWACTPHPDPQRAANGEMLLPRFKMRGREMTYLVRDVYTAQAAAPGARTTRRQHAA